MSGKPIDSSPRLVRDLMTVGVVSCPPQMSIAEVARLLLDRDVEGVIVLDDAGHAVGLVTQDEVIRGYGHPHVHKLTAIDIMREDIPEIPADIPLVAAAQIMQDLSVRVVFLLHHDRGIAWPAAMLSYKHILRHLAAHSEADLRDLGIKATREAPLETFKKKRDAARQRSQSSALTVDTEPNQE